MKDNFSRKEVEDIIRKTKTFSIHQNNTPDYIISEWEKESKAYPEGIIEFRIDKYNTIITHEPERTGNTYQEWCEANLTHAEYEPSNIWTVKNKHGEILTVGGETNNEETILDFSIIDKKIYVGIKMKNSGDKRYVALIADVHPGKSKIKTDDGFEVSSGDSIYIVDGRFDWHKHKAFYIEMACYLKPLFIFYLPENANEFIRMNKPEFSRLDILKVLDETNVGLLKNIPFMKSLGLLKSLNYNKIQ